MPSADTLDRAVLGQLLTQHPAMLDLAELADIVDEGPLSEAVGRLADDGLVSRLGTESGSPGRRCGCTNSPPSGTRVWVDFGASPTP